MDVAFFEAAGLTAVVVVVFALLLRVVQRATQAKDVVVNEAHRLYFAGQLVALVWQTSSIVHGIVDPENSWAHDIGWSFAFSSVGFAIFVVAGQVGARVLLGSAFRAEIDSGNHAAALAGASHHVAVALLIGATCSGNDLFGLTLSLFYFALALVAQQLVVVLFRALTTYDDAEQIAGENMAAALSWSGTALASAIVMARAVTGESDDVVAGLVGFAQVAALALLLLPVRQVLVGGLLFARMPRLRGGPLDEAVGLRHDTATATLDAVIAVGVAVALVRLA